VRAEYKMLLQRTWCCSILYGSKFSFDPENKRKVAQGSFLVINTAILGESFPGNIEITVKRDCFGRGAGEWECRMIMSLLSRVTCTK
jgi:hypothetical protein